MISKRVSDRGGCRNDSLKLFKLMMTLIDKGPINCCVFKEREEPNTINCFSLMWIGGKSFDLNVISRSITWRRT